MAGRRMVEVPDTRSFDEASRWTRDKIEEATGRRVPGAWTYRRALAEMVGVILSLKEREEANES